MNQSFRTSLNRLTHMLMRGICLLGLPLLGVGLLNAQVSTSYTFSGSSGTYDEISGGTLLWGGFGGSFDNSVSSAQDIPDFNFNGTVYSDMYVSTNGFITFGSAPTTTNFSPISGNESYAVAISAFGADLENRSTSFTTRTVRWDIDGNDVVIQWKGARRQNLSENFDFQIRLNTVTNAIVMVYGPLSTPDNATTFQPEVGLRGSSNLLLSNLNSRRVESGGETWAASLAGTSFSHKVRFTNASPAKSWTNGQTYTWTPCTAPTVSVSPNPASYCPGGNVALTASGASSSYTWSPATGLSATTGASVNANPSSLTTYTVVGANTGCAFTGSTTLNVAVKNAPTGVSANASASSVCSGGTVNLTGAGSLPTTILSNNFNSGFGSWTTSNTSTGGTVADAAWTLRANNYFYNASSGTDPTFNSNDNSQFVLSNSDDQAGSTTETVLQTPGFNTEGYSALAVNFYHYYRYNSGTSDRARVEVSTDNTNWTAVQTYSSTQGAANGFVLANVGLNSYVGEEILYVRFRYSSTDDWWWAIDNVSITGTPSAFTWAWTSTPAGYTSSTQSPSGVTVSQTRVYNLTATAGNGCTGTASTATVTAVAPPNAGTNGTLSVCNTSTTASLFAALGGSPNAGGSWTGPSTVVSGNYNATTMTPGVYTYTVTPTAPCVGNATATVTVTEQAPPNAGSNGTLNVCATSTIANIFAALGGSPSAGGSWSGPSTVVSNNYNATTMTPGVYTYTVNATSPCTVNASATVTVTEQATPNAGSNGTLSVCNTSTSANIFAALGGSPDAGGSWSGPSTVVSNNYNATTMTPGVYTYTVNATSPCTGNATATVSVTEQAPPNAGSNGTLNVCATSTTANIFAALGGSPNAGGSWSGPSTVVSNNYNATTMTPGVYTYTANATSPCTGNATATVTVTEQAAPNAGSNGTLSVCATSTTASLFASLGGSPDAGGSWSGPSTVASNNYNATTMTPGVYTYTVNATSPCAVNATAMVTVTEQAPPNAGSNGTLSLCNTSTSANLFAALGGSPDAGGSWSGPSTVVSNNYNATTMTPGVYTYTVNATSPCAVNASATVTVTEQAAPNAGSNGTLSVCNTSTSANLFAALGGSPDAGGSWSGPSTVVSNNYNATTMTPGVYTYTVNATSPCAVNASATVTVTEQTAPNAGTNGTLSICSTDATVALSASLGGTPDGGGSWSGPSTVIGGNYDPAIMVQGVYAYTVNATSPCAVNASATVTVTEQAAPSAGANGTMSVCNTSTSANLFASLGGSPDAGGSWSGPSAVVSNNYNATTMTPGVYTYTVNAISPCTGNVSATVTVSEQLVPNAGSNGSLTICINAGATSLFAQLGGTPDNTGSWSPVLGGGHLGTFTPGTDIAGTYTYTVNATAPCTGSTSATVVVSYDNTDTDGDNTIDCLDNCPNVVGQIGSACDDGVDCTLNDVLDASCNCVGTYTDTDSDGTCDYDDGCPNDPNKVWDGICGCGNPDVDGDGDTVMDCLDGCPSDPNKITPGVCGCGTPDTDTDGDATADCIDLCPLDPSKTAPGTCGCGNADPGTACNDGNPNTGNDMVNANCQCVGVALDCAGTPGGTAQPGTACNDGDPGTVNDVYDTNCACAGTLTGQVVGLTLNTDANGSQTSWEIIPLGGGAALCSGSNYASNSSIPLNCPLADGCYVLRVMDSFGDGMTTGGYVLHDSHNARIIDNDGDGNFTFTSQLVNGLGFCLPLGTDRIRPSRCDLQNLLPTDWVAAEENPAVSAQFGVGNQTDDGYQFWFFNPDGAYSRRVLMTHATNNYLFPWGAARCSYLRLSDLVTLPLPHNTLLNVRVRSRVNGAYSEFGPACRLKIDLVNQCPTPQLVDDTNSPNHSCGLTNVLLDGSTYLHAQYVANVVKYQFEFDDVNSTYLRRIAVPGSALRLVPWATLPLQYGTTYSVRVRVSYDNGTNYCPWGNACTITTAPVPPAQPQGRSMMVEVGEEYHEFRLWPNPNRGDVVNLIADGLSKEATTVNVVIMDLFGKQVHAVQLPITDGSVRQILSLDGRLPAGIYLVTLMDQGSQHVQRLVIE